MLDSRLNLPAVSTKTSRNARPDHTLGHSRRFRRDSATSGLPLTTDVGTGQQVISHLPCELTNCIRILNRSDVELGGPLRFYMLPRTGEWPSLLPL
jgi:hypothetical protein